RYGKRVKMQKRPGGAKKAKGGGVFRKLPAARPWCALACSTGIFCGLSGCAAHTQNTAANDPLLGGVPSRPPIRTPTPTALAPSAAGSLTSNAALAAGAPRPLDNANDLRINDPARTPDSRYPQGSTDWGGTALHHPQPVGDPVARPPVTPPSPAPIPGARVSS